MYGRMCVQVKSVGGSLMYYLRVVVVPMPNITYLVRQVKRMVQETETKAMRPRFVLGFVTKRLMRLPGQQAKTMYPVTVRDDTHKVTPKQPCIAVTQVVSTLNHCLISPPLPYE